MISPPGTGLWSGAAPGSPPLGRSVAESAGVVGLSGAGGEETSWTRASPFLRPVLRNTTVQMSHPRLCQQTGKEPVTNSH